MLLFFVYRVQLMTRRLVSYSVSNSIQLWLFMLVFGLITIKVLMDLMDCAQQDI